MKSDWMERIVLFISLILLFSQSAVINFFMKTDMHVDEINGDQWQRMVR
jgi:hypothetical protein